MELLKLGLVSETAVCLVTNPVSETMLPNEASNWSFNNLSFTWIGALHQTSVSAKTPKQAPVSVSSFGPETAWGT